MKDKHDLQAVDRLILDKIRTVPHLEGLLLLWTARPKLWTAQELAQRLYVSSDTASRILLDLCSEDLAVDAGSVPKRYSYNGAWEQLLSGLEIAYRTDLIRISNLIHSKSAVHEFAKAFRFKKESE